MSRNATDGLAVLVVARITEADRVEVPHANTASQDVVNSARRSGVAVDVAGDAAVIHDGGHPCGFFLRRSAFAGLGWRGFGAWLDDHA